MNVVGKAATLARDAFLSEENANSSRASRKQNRFEKASIELFTSCVGITCHNILSQIATFLSVSSVFKCDPGKTNDKFVTS